MKSKDKLIKAVSTYANRKGISVDAAVSELNKMSEDEINNIFDNMKLFKDGGKLDYLLCLRKGGNMKNCGCGGNVEKKQVGGLAGEKTTINPTQAKNTLFAKIMENLNMVPRVTVDGIQHSAVQFPDGSVRQKAYGDGFTSVLNITPQLDSSVVRINNTGHKKNWSNKAGSNNTMPRELAVEPFKNIKSK